jgi:multimeric flavodoxin WrbA
LHLIDEQIVQADGVIIGAPVYVLGPQGILKVMADRFGPSHDRAFVEEAKKIAAAKGKSEEGPDERIFKDRSGAFITTGGATTVNWLSLSIPMMHLFAFPAHIAIVDEMKINGLFAKYGHAVLSDELKKRARLLGQHVLKHAGKPVVRGTVWYGENQGICPLCHCDLLTVNNNKNPVECPICGIAGELKMENGKITVEFDESQFERARLNMGGKYDHYNEIMSNFRGPGAAASPMIQRMQEIMKKRQEYDGYAELKLK